MNKSVKFGIAAVLLALAVFRIVSCMGRSGTSSTALKHQEVLGARAASLLAEIVEPRGHVLLILAEADAAINRSRERAFAKTAEQAGFSPVTTLVAVPGRDFHPETGLNASFLTRVLEDNPSVAGLVTFAGAPPAIRERRSLPDLPEGVVAVFPNLAAVGPMVQDGRVDRVIGPAATVPDPPPDESASDAEWFAAYYKVLTAGDFENQNESIPNAPPENEVIDNFMSPDA